MLIAKLSTFLTYKSTFNILISYIELFKYIENKVVKPFKKFYTKIFIVIYIFIIKIIISI